MLLSSSTSSNAKGVCGTLYFRLHFRAHFSDTEFIALDPNTGAWNVVRSEIDDVISEHAAKSGARLFQQTKVTSIDFAPDTPSPPPSATLSNGLIFIYSTVFF
ncbi:hypothetical protein SISNIDRAFT_490745 [Sistotremastrum niveocremeum HHB9708]|uniref:Uncharacterized protein n=1 Tax=Sistotremastrum niveocremeum HHB9708 TaxID=1314777 RepID=A0A164NJY4_9AGAM|nr:hypothetical protein SISNIDRAFT_490745 [Sistotremastrum niveocremeum HHB9708]